MARGMPKFLIMPFGVILVTTQHQRAVYSVKIGFQGVCCLESDLVLARYLAALLNQPVYCVLHAHIMDSQPCFYKVCCWCV